MNDSKIDVRRFDGEDTVPDPQDARGKGLTRRRLLWSGGIGLGGLTAGTAAFLSWGVTAETAHGRAVATGRPTASGSPARATASGTPAPTGPGTATPSPTSADALPAGASSAGASSASSQSSTEANQVEPTADRVTRTREEVASYIASMGGRISIAVIDQATGVSMALGSRHFHTASIIKVEILAALLLRAQRRKEPLTAGQRQLAHAMITRSDNPSTSTLWHHLGRRDGLVWANEQFGLVETLPHVGANWGLTKTTARDQLRLLQKITDPGGPLNSESRRYLLDLMARIIKIQSWGVRSAAHPTASAIQFKNGRVQINADQSRWIVNSIGHIVERDHDWLIAVLSDHHPTDSRGIRTVERVAQLALAGLRG